MSLVILYGAVLSLRLTLLGPANLNVTFVTPTLSEAFAETVAVPDTVDPFAGAVNETEEL